MKTTEAELIAELKEAFQDDPIDLEQRKRQKIADAHRQKVANNERKRRDQAMRDVSQRCGLCGSDRLARTYSEGQAPNKTPVAVAAWLRVDESLGRFTIARCRDCQSKYPRHVVSGNIDAWILSERIEDENLTHYWRPTESNGLAPEDCLGALSWAAWEYRARLAGKDPTELLGDGTPFSHVTDAVPVAESLDWNPPLPG